MQAKRELVETALRVLVFRTNGRRPDPADVEKLRRSCPGSADLEIDELCCQIVHDLCGRINWADQNPESEQIIHAA
jgi:hypothetical protein